MKKCCFHDYVEVIVVLYRFFLSSGPDYERPEVASRCATFTPLKSAAFSIHPKSQGASKPALSLAMGLARGGERAGSAKWSVRPAWRRFESGINLACPLPHLWKEVPYFQMVTAWVRRQIPLIIRLSRRFLSAKELGVTSCVDSSQWSGMGSAPRSYSFTGKGRSWLPSFD